ncbi:MAG: uroporphyrinogen decarboxylase family protein [Anaerolineae bacterium]
MNEVKTMTKKERMDAAVRGQPVDRPPVSLWRHFYETEETAQGLAQSMLRWQHTYDWDWMKINPRASYHVEGWGVKLQFSGNAFVKPVTLEVPIQSTRDWAKLKPLPLDTGELAEQLEAIGLIRQGLGLDVYAIETVFNPVSIAGDMVADKQTLVAHMQEDPQALHGALEVITETFRAFARRCLQAGASGLFFATTHWGSYDLLTDEQYAEFGRPYDLRVLDAVQDAPLNVLHVCKNHNMALKLADYPVHAINWAVGSPGNPSLEEVQKVTQAAVMGGFRNETLLSGPESAIFAEARAAAEATGDRRWVLGPACSISVETPDAHVRAARQAADEIASA